VEDVIQLGNLNGIFSHLKSACQLSSSEGIIGAKLFLHNIGESKGGWAIEQNLSSCEVKMADISAKNLWKLFL